MKIIPLFVSCSLVLASVSFAETPPKEVQKDNSTNKQSTYKASPRLSYHSHETKGHPGLEKLKPMLNQLGNSSPGSVTPGGAGMTF